MTDTTERDAAQDILAIHAETMGADFVAALLTELRQMPDHWARLNEKNQQQIIERIKEKVRGAVLKAQGMLLRAGCAAVPADLEAVGFKNGISAQLKIPKDALHRHELADAQGTRVLVVIADGNRWLERMDEIKAKSDQLDLLEQDYDPSKDQPGYRRDQDRIAPAAPTWEDLKKSLKTGEPESKPAPDASDGDAPGADIVFGSASDEKQSAEVELRILQEKLATVGCNVSLGALQALAGEQLKISAEWVDVFARDPSNCPVARPLWLPIPDQQSGEEGNDANASK